MLPHAATLALLQSAHSESDGGEERERERGEGEQEGKSVEGERRGGGFQQI